MRTVEDATTMVIVVLLYSCLPLVSGVPAVALASLDDPVAVA